MSKQGKSDTSEWLELKGFADVTCWIDAPELERAPPPPPSADFEGRIYDFTTGELLGEYARGRLLPANMEAEARPRGLRWKLTSPPSAWDLTFRVTVPHDEERQDERDEE